MLGKCMIIGLCLTISAAFAQQANRIDLGNLQTGATVSFVRAADGEWGIEISGGPIPRVSQQKPARLEIYRSDQDIREFAAGYKTIKQLSSGIDARTEIIYGDHAVFHVEDLWSLSGSVVSVHRKIEVLGNAAGGFNSSVVVSVDSAINWSDMNCMIPGTLYGDPTYNGDTSPGGTKNYTAHRFQLREDMLPAPLIALSFSNGSSVAMLDPSPRGESTIEETRLSKNVMTDARFQFGALGVRQKEMSPIEFSFQFPGTMSMYPFSPNAPAQLRTIRRFHPITPGVVHNYEVSFRFGLNELVS